MDRLCCSICKSLSKPCKCIQLEVYFTYLAFSGHWWRRASLDAIFVVSCLSRAKYIFARSGLQNYSIGEEKSHGDTGEENHLREVSWPNFLLHGAPLGRCGCLGVDLEAQSCHTVYAGPLSVNEMWPASLLFLPASLLCLLSCPSYHDRLRCATMPIPSYWGPLPCFLRLGLLLRL